MKARMTAAVLMTAAALSCTKFGQSETITDLGFEVATEVAFNSGYLSNTLSVRLESGTEGVYVLSGTLADGQVVVQAGEAGKVQLVLDGAEITSADSAAICCMEADKVFLTLAEGTENALANGGAFSDADGTGIDAAVYAKTDLTLNGAGSLTVTSPAGHGIVSKDELTVTGGSYAVEAAGHGLTGKDGVAIAAGSFVITAGKDGIHAEHGTNARKGNLYIADGSFAVTSQGDALSATGWLQIDGGSFALTAGGGSDSVEMSSGDMMPWGGGFRGFGAAGSAPQTAQETENTQSCKGIKADGPIAVNGGTFTLDTADDAVHGGADVTLTGGMWSIRTGDDAVHADGAVTVTGGTYGISRCYEGVAVVITGGNHNTSCTKKRRTFSDAFFIRSYHGQAAPGEV